ncbi:MAG: radical SAM protein [Acidobacteria bacterium]|nr:radical SAM protein [Acidobacteriota bacterium]
MKKTAIIPAWGSILRGKKPFLSVAITKECPLSCPGCYAYEPEHLQGGIALHQLRDLRGENLVEGMLAVVRRFRPLHLSIVGGEPLVRYRELDILLPKLRDMGIEVQLVTSAVRPIPIAWVSLSNLHLVVSVDGLAPEHDRRRSPATYERILKHIAGHQVIIHCVVTRQLLERSDYLADFASFWSARPEVRKIWFSLFTPQHSSESEERLLAEDRQAAILQLVHTRNRFPKVYLPDIVLRGYLRPPHSPDACIFAQITTCFSADLSTPITPCQFGGRPVCSECGCIASAGLAAIGSYKLFGLLPVSAIFNLSQKIGTRLARNGYVPQHSL